jgi:hypothetical protein
MNPMLLHALRYGVTGNQSCTPTFIRVEFTTGETIEFDGEALLRLNDDLGRIVQFMMKPREEVFDNEDFREK